MLSIHREVLDKKRILLFNKLRAFRSYGYLAGGTALALQIGHRRSVDFDIFIPKPLSNIFTNEVLSILGKSSTVRMNSSDFVFIQTPEQVEFNFVYYWYPSLNPTIPTKSISLASVSDIAADKAHTIGRRAVWRDYVDVAVLLDQKILTLPEIIQAAMRKFKQEFVEIQFLEQLTFFEDVEVRPMEFIKRQYTSDKVKHILKSAVREYTRQLLVQ